MAPILCAGVTTYKGLKETEARPGEWVAISGIGGLGHVAIQYAKAMGLQVVALDVSADKLALAAPLGAEIAVDARSPDAVAEVVKAHRRRRAWRAGDRGFAAGVRPGAAHGAPQGHGQPGRPAARANFQRRSSMSC